MNKLMTMGEQEELLDALRMIVGFAADARKQYEATKEWTATQGSSCMTIRVPTALLLRIRDVGEFLQQLKTEQAA